MRILHPAILHGGDYNPEQWPESVWADDMRLMKAAGCNTMTVGVFAWSVLEPTEGVYRFEWLDRVMDLLHANGMRAVLATPSAAHPPWLSHNYPEVLRTASNRVRHEHRVRVNYCLTAPAYRRACAAMATQMARRYKDHPALMLWHVSNEYHDDCHCELCQEAFRGWLQHKYGTLAALNDAWDNAIWSHRYSDWAQVRSPQPWPAGEWSMLALGMDWRRFVTDQSLACFLNEARILRALTPKVPLTTNMHQTTWGFIDWARFAPHVDIMSWDNYPEYHADAGDVVRAVEVGFAHDFYRSAKRQPFLMMESNPGSAQGKRQKRPGIHRLQSLQAVAHGSDSVQYFQWRNCRSGVEKYHGAVVNHDCSPDARVFREVAALGGELAKLDGVRGATVPAEIAVVYDKQVHWAVEYATTARWDERSYIQTAHAHYAPFWKRGLNVDVIESTTDLSPYRVVVAPVLYMLRPGVAESLTKFVKAGGTLVTSYWSGYVDENDRAFSGGFPGPLKELLGVCSEELDCLDAPESNRVAAVAGNALGLTEGGVARHFCDVLRVEGAEVLATFADQYYAGRPALTRNRVGKGMTYYVGGLFDQAFLERFYAALMAQTEVKPLLSEPPPSGVCVRTRETGSGRYFFLLNFAPESRELAGLAGATLVTGAADATATGWRLPANGAAVLHLQHQAG